jgi:hypothetical protein
MARTRKAAFRFGNNMIRQAKRNNYQSQWQSWLSAIFVYVHLLVFRERYQ